MLGPWPCPGLNNQSYKATINSQPANQVLFQIERCFIKLEAFTPDYLIEHLLHLDILYMPGVHQEGFGLILLDTNDSCLIFIGFSW